MPNDTVNKVILDLLEENGWSKEDFAAMIGITTAQLAAILYSNAPLTDDLITVIACATGTSEIYWRTLVERSN